MTIKKILAKYNSRKYFHYLFFVIPVLIVFVSFLITLILNKENTNLKENNQKLSDKYLELDQKFQTVNIQLKDLQNQNQYKINQDLNARIKNIENTYKKASDDYEKLLDLKTNKVGTDKMDELFAKSLNLLSDQNYASAESTLSELNSQIESENIKLAAAASKTNSYIPTSNTPPNSGYNRQNVQSDMGNFTVDIISADLATTRVIVDTASNSNCNNDCPTLPLVDYVSRNQAFAGINGSFFCPSTYPSCAGKTNSFDLLVMNKNKVYFNSDNNVYSTNPAVIFGNGWIRFVGKALEWGRDTSPDGVLSNFPLLVQGNQIVYSGSSDQKFTIRSTRNFVANKGNTVYIGVIYNATMEESAHILKTLGMENAMNLDEGGSTALWYGNYIAGPGRNIPNAILFIKK